MLLFRILCLPNDSTAEVKQQYCMFKLIGAMWNNGLLLPSGSPEWLMEDVYKSFRVCDWTEVHCTNGRVTSIRWALHDRREHSLKAMNIHWIPHTVTVLQISSEQNVVQKAPFATRILPRDSESIQLRGLGMTGTLDLLSVPRKLTALDVSLNLLSGTVYIGNLPHNLVRILADSNPIEAIVVNNHTIPAIFIEATFFWHKKIAVKEVSGELVDNRITIEVLGRNKIRRIS